MEYYRYDESNRKIPLKIYAKKQFSVLVVLGVFVCSLSRYYIFSFSLFSDFVIRQSFECSEIFVVKLRTKRKEKKLKKIRAFTTFTAIFVLFFSSRLSIIFLFFDFCLLVNITCYASIHFCCSKCLKSKAMTTEIIKIEMTNEVV